MTMTDKRFTVMKRTQTVHLLFISGFFSFAIGSSDFHLINQQKNYVDSKTYCRQMYSDLASVHNITDMNNLINLVATNITRAWIGLESEGVWEWHWSQPYQKLDFFNWKAGEPQNTDQDACAVMDPLGEWFESECGTERSFVCQGNVDSDSHIFVATTKSWRNAQNHCRGLSSELVSIHSVEENKAVLNISLSQNVWIGLFRDPWKWSDGSNSSFRFWKPGQPNYFIDQDCVLGIFGNDGRWNDLRCTRTEAFICRGASKLIPATTIQPSTQLSETTNEQPTNLTTPLNTSPQELTTTYHFTLTSSNGLNVTNVTTEEKTTTVKVVTPNTTTELLNVTATQLPPNATVQATTGDASSTTLMRTSAKTSTQLKQTTQPSPPKTTENSQSWPPGDLILIKKNLTWIDAMSYCRKHHVDLVHITTKEIQVKVAEKAKNATSLHVWLGLRYTCNLSFWFWTSSSTGCYQNWAPGQGSEGIYDCEASGAIEATGRQQWVGLSQTEKLNFLCSTCAT